MERKTFLFVHGAWHSSIHWGHVVEQLIEQGHTAIAIDLPGSGLNATYSNAFLARDKDARVTELTATRDIGLDSYADAICRMLKGLTRNGSQAILVGHSFGGQSITQAAERMPQLLERLVYVSAFCPALQPGGSADYYSMLAENNRSMIGPLLIGDPEKIGAYRFDVPSQDPAYLELCRQTFYNDMPMDAFLRFASCLNADAPAKASGDDGRGTADRWGSVPRTYVRCTLDQALPIELQDRMIHEADRMTPENRFEVRTLKSSHSPFASVPDQLVRILTGR